MPSPVFEQAYLLQALGWAIANSLWQTGSLWLLYQCITHIDKQLSAFVKHHLSNLLLFISFTWFLFTILQNYRLLIGGAASTGLLLNEWSLRLQALNKALPFVSIIYLLLLCFHTARFFKGISANRFIQTNGLTRPPIELRLFISKTALHLGIKRKIRIWLSEQVDVPSVTGFIKPVILLPAAIVNNLSIRQTEAILLHELAHIKRNDYLVNFLQTIIELILFFNPFAIMLSSIAKRERENCCDDWVMNFQYDRFEYASALVLLEEQRQFTQYSLSIAATNGKKNLLNRVKRLFTVEPQTDFSSCKKFKLVSFCILLLGAVLFAIPNIKDNTALNSAIAKKIQVNNKMEKPVVVKTAITHGENTAKNILPGLPVKSKKEEATTVLNSKQKKRAANKNSNNEYVNGLINEELLNPLTKFNPTIIQVANEVKKSKYFLKIVEQQAGIKQTNIYYFELNNKNGHATVKPLMMLNKFKSNTSFNKAPLKNLNDSLEHLTKAINKKRVTT